MVVVGYLGLMLAVGLREQRRALVGVWLMTGAAGFALELFGGADGDGIHLVLFVLSGVVLLITGMFRERGDAQRRLVEQETISEAERSRRTLLEERARIARELHDVVAHHMSVITVQADSAPYRIEGLPEAAREEFSSIAASARESLAEMRRLLTVLRSENTEGERAPQPGIDRVQQLVEATIRAGLPVELSLAADLGAVPQAVDLSAYRIVQEALSNVVRHAPGARTRVSVSRSPNLEWLIVLVVNGPPTEPTPSLEASGTGHGLIGMRERVRLTGGMLDTGPLPDGGFRVAARLPLIAALPGMPERALMTIRVIIVDDQAMVRAGFAALLSAQPDIDVVGEAPDGRAGVEVGRSAHPDVVLMDVRMPEMDGLAAARELLNPPPGVTHRPKVLMLTTFDVDDYVYEALRAGASGFLLKDAPPADLIAAVRVVAGARRCSPRR